MWEAADIKFQMPVWQQVEDIETNMPPSSLGENETFRWRKKDELHVFFETGKAHEGRLTFPLTEKTQRNFAVPECSQQQKITKKTWNRENLNFSFPFFLIATPICWTTYRKWIEMFTMCFA